MNYIVVDISGLYVTHNDDNAGYYGYKEFTLPEGKTACSVMWHTNVYQGGVSLDISQSYVIVVSPISLQLPTTGSPRLVRVYYI